MHPATPDFVAILVGTSTSPDGHDAAALEAAGFGGTVGEVHLVAGVPPTVLVGVGDLPLDLASARDVGAAIAGAVPGLTSVSVDVGDVDADVAQGLVEGVILARYSWDALRAEPARTQVEAITLVSSSDAVSAGARRGHLTALATAVARDLSNTPPAHLTAVRWADVARTCGSAVRPRCRDPRP